jgi:hypothetical protein
VVWYPVFILLALVLEVATAGRSHGQQEAVNLNITIQELPADMKPLEKDIRENIVAAANLWLRAVVAKRCSIEIEFKIKPWPARGFGHSVAGVLLPGEKANGKHLVEEGMAHELRTGTDPNGAEPDVEIAFDPEYVKTMWWDPNPRSRTRPVPSDKLDAVSVIAHELGHAIGFNGRIDPKTGQPTAGELSPYDRWVTYEGGNFSFTGPAATKAYHKPIPLSKTQTNYHHFGEPGPKLDRKLKDDLMNGIFMEYGKRYVVSGIDLAVLTDCGLEVRE